jgi:hypothetical protein
VSHRDRDPEHAALERGNDWLDGALAGWLLFLAINAGNLALGHVRAGTTGSVEFVYMVAIPLVAVASIVPLLRFHQVGWYLAAMVLLLMAVVEAADLASSATGWITDLPFLAIDLAGLAYLLYIRPEFWHDAPDVEPEPATAASGGAAGADEGAEAESPPASVVPAPRPIPVTMALAAIHHRIVAAGSACAVAPASVRAEAGRFGVTPGMLRNEGLTLYGTFLTFFLSDGPLTADEERELACLERALDLDYTSVQAMRVDAGAVRSLSDSPASAIAAATPPAAPPEPEPAADASADFAPRPGPGVHSDPSAQADITSSEPRIHSPGMFVAGSDSDAPTESAELASEVEAADSVEAETAEVDEEPAVDTVDAIDSVDAADTVDTVDANDSVGAADTVDAADAVDAADLADYEEHELTALLRWAGVPRPAAGSARGVLERLRALHRTATEPLEACTSDHPMEPGERCIVNRTVELYRMPAGAPPTGSADVPAPVLDPRALVDGSVDADRDLAGFQRAGACRFLLTDRRLLLVAPNGQQSPLPLDRVRAVQPHRNGLEVRPLRGSPVFLAFTGGVDDVAMRLDRAARDLRARPA